MITIKTESGSTYEVDDERKLVRRLGADYRENPRAVEDWRAYKWIAGLRVGASMMIGWPAGVELLDGRPSDEDEIATTLTSRVVEVLG